MFAKLKRAVAVLFNAETDDEERLRAQLAGCAVAAMGGSEVAHPGDYGWSASYEDVLELRRRYDALGKILEAVPTVADLRAANKRIGNQRRANKDLQVLADRYRGALTAVRNQLAADAMMDPDDLAIVKVIDAALLAGAK